MNHQWANAFTTEARLQGMSGARVGDALATVDAHVAETGESAVEAFGDPVAYAKELSATTAHPQWLSPASMLSTGLGLLALILLPRVVTALLENAGVAFTRADLIVLPAVAALTGCLLAWPDPILRFLVTRRVAGVVLMALLIFALVAVGSSAPGGTVMELSVWLVGVLGLACLVASSILALRQPVDLVEPPSGVSVKAVRNARLLSAAMFPGFTAVMCLFSVVMARLS